MMIEQDWRRRVDRFVAGYERGVYTALELRCAVVEAMPVEKAAELVSRLPPEIIQLLHQRAVEVGRWSDSDLASLITINGPEPSEESRQLFRAKWSALNACLVGRSSDNT